MLRRATKQDLHLLVDFLKRKLPASMTMLALIQMEQEFNIGRRIYVSDSDPTLFIFGHGINTLAPSFSLFWDAERLQEEQMKTYMKQVPDWDWYSSFELICIDDGIVEQMNSILSQAKISPSHFKIKEFSGTLFEMKPQDIQDKTLPKGFKFGKLKPEHIPLVFENWEFGYGEKASHYTKLVTKSLSSAVYKIDDECCENPLAWTLLYDFGLIGITFTRPEFRRLGLASAITNDLCRKISRTKIPIILCIMMNNPDSYAFHKKLGFLPVGVAVKWDFYKVEQ